MQIKKMLIACMLRTCVPVPKSLKTVRGAMLSTEGAINNTSSTTSRSYCQKGKKVGDTMANVNEAARPLAWLLGHWESFEAIGEFPTIKPFTYREDLTFTHVGQPLVNFFTEAWDPTSDKPLHRESGFIRIQPGTNKVAYICAQNIGIVDLEEGEVNGTSIDVETKMIGRMSFSSLPATTQIKRTFRLNADDVLEQIVFMATEKTPSLTKHLHVKYKKKESS